MTKYYIYTVTTKENVNRYFEGDFRVRVNRVPVEMNIGNYSVTDYIGEKFDKGFIVVIEEA